VSFAVAPEAYDRFMGRYSVPLAPQLAALAEVVAGQRALDVGCGPGALTAELVRRLGPAAVAAVDPSEPFVDAARERHPGVNVERAPAEELPFPDEAFDAALAQLVVHFMADPVRGLREMARVTREGGIVAACVWDHAVGGQGPLSLYWDAARELDPDFVIVARCDMIGAQGGGFEVAVERCTAYLEHGGVDAVWINTVQSAEEVREACGAVPGPVDEHEAAGAGAGERALGDRGGEGCRDAGVDRVSALGERAGAGLCGQWVAPGDGALHGVRA